MIYLSFSRIFSCFLLYCLFIIFESLPIAKALSDKSEAAFFIQCSRLIPFSFILCISHTPSSSAEISFSTSPLKRIHGTPNFSAMSETLLGSLPNRVCLSVLPSPVITASERRILSSSDAALASTSNPLWSSQFKKADNPPPMPPAAPAPGRFIIFLPYAFSKISPIFRKPSSKGSTSFFEAPFCGEKT